MRMSRPVAEKRQMSAAAAAVEGRCKGTGFPASEQELLAVEKAPRAATFRSTSAFGRETPAVVGSTTVMFLAVAAGEVGGGGGFLFRSIRGEEGGENTVGMGVIRVWDLVGRVRGAQ